MKRRDFNEVEKSLGFDSQKEVKKYNYLCTRKTKKLNKEEQFTSFHSWKEHIKAKYNDCTKEQLEELSRFLKLGERNCKDTIAICCTLFPVILSIGINLLINIFSASVMSFGNNTDLVNAVSILILFIVMLIGILIILCTCIIMIGKQQDYRNMYHDYDEVISGILEKNS